MPAENIDKMSIQNKSLVSNIHLHAELKANAAQGKSSNTPNEEESSSSVLSNNESTNSLKRPSVDELNSDILKKFRLAENIVAENIVGENIDDEQIEDTGSNMNENDHMESLILKIDEIAMKKENKNNRHSNFNKETQGDNSFNDNNVNGNESGIDKEKVNSVRKKYICKEVNKNTKNNESTNNTEDVSRIIENDYSTTKTFLNNKSPELSNESSAAIVENNEIIQSPESNGREIINITKKESKEKAMESQVKVNASGIHNGLMLKKPKQINVSDSVIENEVEMIEIDPVTKDTFLDRTKDSNDNIDKDFEIIVSDSDSDISDDNESYNKKLVNDILKGIKNLDKNNFLEFMKLFSMSEMIFDQFESYCTQKFIGVLTEKGDFGENRYRTQLLENKVKMWREKYILLYKQMKEFKSVLKMHMSEVKVDKFAKPHIIKRTVGLQAFVSQGTQVSQIPSSSKRPNHVQLPNAVAQESVDITTIDDDDDDNDEGDDAVVFVDTDINESTPKPSTSKVIETIPKKVLSSTEATSKTIETTPKKVLSSTQATSKTIEIIPKKVIGSTPSISKTTETTLKKVSSSKPSTSKTIETTPKKVLDSKLSAEKTIETTSKKVLNSKPSTSKTTETTPKKLSNSILSTSKTTETTSKKESSSKPSTSKTIETTPKKSTITPSSPVILKPSTVVLKKVCPPLSPLDIANNDVNCTIDLTGSDDIIDVTNGFNTENSPNKIVKYSTINTHISAGTSSQLKHLTAQVDLSSLAFIELSKLPHTASSYMVKTSSTTGLTQFMPFPIDPSQPVSPIIIRDGKLLSVQISPAVNSASSVINSASSIVNSSSSVVNSAPKVPVTLQQLPRPQLARPLLPVPPAIPIHPAHLPTIPNQRSLPAWKKLPPAPKLSLSISTENSRALILSWNMHLSSSIADISTYQIYAYPEIATQIPRQDLWRRIGEVNALPLPMACSLTQFSSGENYHFAVRAVDIHARVGPFSETKSIYNPR